MKFHLEKGTLVRVVGEGVQQLSLTTAPLQKL